MFSTSAILFYDQVARQVAGTSNNLALMADFVYVLSDYFYVYFSEFLKVVASSRTY